MIRIRLNGRFDITESDSFIGNEMTGDVFSIFKRILGLNVTQCLPERLPSYSSHTEDILYKDNDGLMELCSISQRTDYAHQVLEIAIGMDRCVYKFLE